MSDSPSSESRQTPRARSAFGAPDHARADAQTNLIFSAIGALVILPIMWFGYRAVDRALSTGGEETTPAVTAPAAPPEAPAEAAAAPAAEAVEEAAAAVEETAAPAVEAVEEAAAAVEGTEAEPEAAPAE